MKRAQNQLLEWIGRCSGKLSRAFERFLFWDMKFWEGVNESLGWDFQEPEMRASAVISKVENTDEVASHG